MSNPFNNTPVILMRPGEANNRLQEYLKLHGIESWSWPAFEIAFPDEEEQKRIEERLSNLDDVEMVVIPSPAAVAAVAHWVDKWPEHITLATVGEGTARVIRTAWGEDVKLVAPACDAVNSGSEALWELIRERGAPSRVLFLRGQTGREYLPGKFREMGTDVVTYCAYVRVPIELNPQQRRDLSRAMMGPSPIVYLTSSDAVDAFFRALRVVPGAREWVVNGVAVTLHPRIIRRLKEAGFKKIEVCSTDDDVVMKTIQKYLPRAQYEREGFMNTSF